MECGLYAMLTSSNKFIFEHHAKYVHYFQKNLFIKLDLMFIVTQM